MQEPFVSVLIGRREQIGGPKFRAISYRFVNEADIREIELNGKLEKSFEAAVYNSWGVNYLDK